MEYSEDYLERTKHEWECRTQVFQDTPFITETEVSKLIQSKVRPQSQQDRMACAYTFTVELAVAASFTLLLIKAWASANLLAIIICALLQIIALCLCITTAYELFLLLMMHCHRFRLSKMDTYFEHYQRLGEHRSQFRDTHMVFNIIHSGPRVRIAMAMMSIVLLAGIVTWFVLGSGHSSHEFFLASNHNAQFKTASIVVSPATNTTPALAANQPTLTASSHESSSAVTEIISHSEPVVGVVETARVSSEITSPSEYEGEKVTLIDGINQLVAQADVQIICNSNYCAAERYYAMVYEDILGRY